jgi:hypothetical protein
VVTKKFLGEILEKYVYRVSQKKRQRETDRDRERKKESIAPLFNARIPTIHTPN